VSIEPDDKVKAFINVKNLEDENYINNNHIVMCTKKGTIKKTLLEAYSRPRQSGIIAININEGDQLLEAKLTNGTNEILLASKKGKVVRFNESTVRDMGRGATGVRGITLDGDDDEVVGMVTVTDPKSETVLVVAENGYGKRSDVEEYRITNRGGKGVKTINITDKTGMLIAIKVVREDDDLMIINKSGIIIRMNVDELRVMGRATQGVRVIRLEEGDSIASVTKVEEEKEGSAAENDTENISAELNPENNSEPDVESSEGENPEQPTE
jgi:DNA gyrase subunit A